MLVNYTKPTRLDWPLSFCAIYKLDFFFFFWGTILQISVILVSSLPKNLPSQNNINKTKYFQTFHLSFSIEGTGVCFRSILQPIPLHTWSCMMHVIRLKGTRKRKMGEKHKSFILFSTTAQITYYDWRLTLTIMVSNCQ